MDERTLDKWVYNATNLTRCCATCKHGVAVEMYGKDDVLCMRPGVNWKSSISYATGFCRDYKVKEQKDA